jgi:hypothetical protein
LPANRAEVHRRYDEDEADRIRLALHTLTSSQLRIEIFGGTSRYQGSTGAARMYRIIGARTMYRAAVLRQHTEGDTEGRIRLRLCRPENLPAHLVSTLPRRGPGGHAALTVHPGELREYRRSSTGNTPAERYRRLLDGPMDGGGSARLRIGPFNTDPAPAATLHWYDLADGRYLEIRDEHVSIRPAGTTEIASRFAALIERALRRIRDERRETW